MTIVNPDIEFPDLSYLVSAFLIFLCVQQKIAEYRNKKFLADAVAQLKRMILQEKQCSQYSVVLIDEKYYEKHLVEEMKQVHIELRPLKWKNKMEVADADAVLVELKATDAKHVQKIRCFKDNVPIYGITKSENLEELIKAMDTGMNGTLEYPLSVPVLADVIERTI